MKLQDHALGEHFWLVDAVRAGLMELQAVELATVPVEGKDGRLERLMIATDLGLVEGTLASPPVDGFPGLTLDLRLWRDVRVSARVRVDSHAGAHFARAILTIGDRTVTTYESNTREAAEDFVREVVRQASRNRET